MRKNSLLNRKNKTQLDDELKTETFDRKTCSFYRYVKINDVYKVRNQLYAELKKINVLGRIYIASEGINAQISVPHFNLEKLIEVLNSFNKFKKIDVKTAINQENNSFIKLIVRVKNKIVADGLTSDVFENSNNGKYLTAKEFNNAMEEPNSIVVDIRNYYESEVGHFENAICPNVETFKELLPLVKDMLNGHEKNKILLYCTGGIRCEKASAYLNNHDFENVYQLKGGIIAYAHQIKGEKLTCKFKGKNFVFDARMGEKITTDIISTCHQCDSPSNKHVNCANQACHILFIQCNMCNKEFKGCCSKYCLEIINKPEAEQKKLRKHPFKAAPLRKFQRGPKPRLKDLLNASSKASEL